MASPNGKSAVLITREDLRRAIQKQEFVIFYQPQVDLKTGRVVASEALLRWQIPGGPLVPPLDFIPLAERTGLIVPIGEWVLREACCQTRQWQKDGWPTLAVGVNLSARQFQQQDLTAHIREALVETELAPASLDLEITESHAMQDPEYALSVMNDLKAMQVRLSIDDFGTGYSSLSFLKRFPIHTLKIDRSFVKDLAKDEKDEAIVSAIILLAHRLGMEVIGEGVETMEDLAVLQRYHCDRIQGYLFAKPLPAAEFAALLQSDRRLTLPVSAL